MAVEKSVKRSKSTSRSEDAAMGVDEVAATQKGSAKEHKKSKKADQSYETTVPPAVTDIPSLEKHKKKRKRDQPTPAEPLDDTKGNEEVDAAADTPKKKKRKHAKAEAEEARDAAVAAEEQRKRKKRKHDAPSEPHGESTPPVGMVEEDGEDIGDKPKKKYPHPAKDESLSEQAVKALSYAYTYHKHRDVWKFSKAHQNWLIRHCWSTIEIPDDYIPLLKKYLKNLQGGARERLLETCQSILEAAEAPEDSEHAATPEKDEAEPAAEGDAESPSKSVRFAETTKEADATTKPGSAAKAPEVVAKKSTRPPESKVKRAKAFVKVLSS
ncbi:hypothetical protein K525DRAFT_211138 [Schizophyllum commune Loenen D]|nr:hypothetical protein K525DRAFT_211138 [Schizophyllum commune Loenen D]